MIKVWKGLKTTLKFIALSPVYFYKYCISPIIPHACKFTPTCSVYAGEAFAEWGFFIGSKLTAQRLVRCNPKAISRTDPVPVNPKKKYKNFM